MLTDRGVIQSLVSTDSSAQFSSVQDGGYALGKAHMHSIQSLRSFPNVALETVPMLVWLTMALSRPLKQDRWAFSLSTPYLLQAIDGVMSLALCPHVVSQAPKHFRSSETQAACDGDFARQSICSVISLDSTPTEFFQTWKGKIG